MKAWKKLLIYLAFIIGILIVVVLVGFAVMYFSPGTSILGYEYVLYNNEKIEEYTLSTNPSVSGIQAIEIITEESDIYIYPNTESDKLTIYHNQGLSGFVKSVNADLVMNVDVQTKSFEESLVSYKTFSINLNEPNGWIAKSNAAVYVYVPNNITPSTIYARSNSGDIHYISENEEEIEVDGQKQTKTHDLNCINLYMKTGNYGKLNIDNKHNISNYYLKTSMGKVSFYDVTAINANTVKFETDSGLFDLRNAKGDATLTLSDKLEIRSYDDYIGPTVYINKLVGNLTVDADNGLYDIGTIGSHGSNKIIAMTVNRAKIRFGDVYGYVSILGQGNDISNDIYIKNHVYDSVINTSVYECGSAPVTIDNLNANASFDATSGNINIKTATTSSNIYAYSNSGSINVNYVSSKEDHPETKLTILTKTGNINLNNVSCLLEIQVMENSSSSSLNIVFTAVAYKQENGVVYDNIIEAKNRRVNLTLEGVSDNLQFRIASTCAVSIAEGTVGQDISTEYDSDGVVNNDYLLRTEGYTNYTHCYRIGYNKGNENYDSYAFDKWGKLLITASSINVNSRGL